MRCQIVIPARLASTRLPEKLLRKVAGKSILHHTFIAASKSQIADSVMIAVDDKRLADEVDAFGGRWIMTDPNCASGTDRIAEVAAAMPDVDVFINVQGDEPEIDPATIDVVAEQLIHDTGADIATVCTPIRETSLLTDPSCVKIVLAIDPQIQCISAHQGRAGGAKQRIDAVTGRAIYFSRSVVPHPRSGIDAEALNANPPLFWHHIGLYAYRRDFLNWFASQPPSLLELTERLEQLRAIEAGKKIVVTSVESAAPGIDTIEDLNAFIERFSS